MVGLIPKVPSRQRSFSSPELPSRFHDVYDRSAIDGPSPWMLPASFQIDRLLSPNQDEPSDPELSPVMFTVDRHMDSENGYPDLPPSASWRLQRSSEGLLQSAGWLTDAGARSMPDALEVAVRRENWLKALRLEAPGQVLAGPSHRVSSTPAMHITYNRNYQTPSSGEPSISSVYAAARQASWRPGMAYSMGTSDKKEEGYETGRSSNKGGSEASPPRQISTSTSENMLKATCVAIIGIWKDAEAEDLHNHSSSVRMGESSTSTPSDGVLPLANFVKAVLRRSRTTMSSLQTALHYIYRARNEIGRRIKLTEDAKQQLWQFTVSADPASLGAGMDIFSSVTAAELLQRASDPIACGRRIFIAAVMVATKFLQDDHCNNRAWSKVTGLPFREVSSNERLFLKLLDYNLFVRPADFFSWTARLQLLIDRINACETEGSLEPSKLESGSEGMLSASLLRRSQSDATHINLEMDRSLKASSPEGPPLKGIGAIESPGGLADQTSRLTLSARMRRAVSDPRHHRVNQEVRLPHLGPRRESALSKIGETSAWTSEEVALPTLLYDSPQKKQSEDMSSLPRPTLIPKRRSRTTSGVVSQNPTHIPGLSAYALPRPQLRSSSTRTSASHISSSSFLPRPSLSQRSTGILDSSSLGSGSKDLRSDSKGMPHTTDVSSIPRDKIDAFKRDERMF